MTNYIRRFRAPLALCAALAAAACTVKDNKSDSTLAADSALNRDLQLANQDTSLQPQLQDVPATPAQPAPATSTPSGTPASRPTTSRPSTTTSRPTTTKKPT
ncbi:MAG TPA: hypothetical protein VFY85_05110, partial [Gemmatimonadaceae bacterium]|nr:hypothetical protein [Gemmatimonadaceae bacterium]